MNKIPVEFDYEGKHCRGHLSEVFGAGAKVWHLMVDNYYWGQLSCNENGDWMFYNNKGLHKELADHFGEIVMLWYE